MDSCISANNFKLAMVRNLCCTGYFQKRPEFFLDVFVFRDARQMSERISWT
ncbi:MAG: hypothetical protein JWQ78_1094 [Sediminibacterium sp.]|nr:hypothetical protein [Sediminibacterium sp.]